MLSRGVPHAPTRHATNDVRRRPSPRRRASRIRISPLASGVASYSSLGRLDGVVLCVFTFYIDTMEGESKLEAEASNLDAKRPREVDEAAAAPSSEAKQEQQPRKKARREEKCCKCKTRLSRRGMFL